MSSKVRTVCLTAAAFATLLGLWLWPRAPEESPSPPGAVVAAPRTVPGVEPAPTTDEKVAIGTGFEPAAVTTTPVEHLKPTERRVEVGTFEVSGRVLDADDAPVAGVIVHASKPAGQPEQVAGTSGWKSAEVERIQSVTDELGRFRFDLTGPEEVTLDIRRSGPPEWIEPLSRKAVRVTPPATELALRAERLKTGHLKIKLLDKDKDEWVQTFEVRIKSTTGPSGWSIKRKTASGLIEYEAPTWDGRAQVVVKLDLELLPTGLLPPSRNLRKFNQLGLPDVEQSFELLSGQELDVVLELP